MKRAMLLAILCAGPLTIACDDNDSGGDTDTENECLDPEACDCVWEGDYTIFDEADLDALSGYQEVTGSLNIIDAQLTGLSGLECLTTVGEYLTIERNDSLVNVEGLSALTTVKGIRIGTVEGGNAALTRLDGLSGITSLEGSLALYYNPVLGNLDGLSGIASVGEVLSIGTNPALTNLDGLSQITSVGQNLVIHDNDGLTGLDGLSQLTSVGSSVFINGNDSLDSLDGLSALTSVGGELEIYINANLPDCETCELLDQLTTWPTGISVYFNLDDECTPVPDNCP